MQVPTVFSTDLSAQVFIAAWSGAYTPDEERPQPGLLDTQWAFGVYAPTAAPITLPKLEVPWKKFPPPEVSVRPWVITFSVICSAGAVSLLVYTALGYYASLQASRSLFLKMLKRLVRAPSRFLDVTPIGRILNRFTAGLMPTFSVFIHELTRELRHQNRGWGTPELREGCIRRNAELLDFVNRHHLGCANLRTSSGNPFVVLH